MKILTEQNKKVEILFSENSFSLEEKVDFLKKPNAYPFSVNRVETKETHMSWIFYVNGFVYKLKKNICHLFLDLTTLESRYFNCQDEVLLNKRLAPEIYLGLIPLTVKKNGELKLDGEGEIIDWLVRMKRIPDEDILDYAIQHKHVNKDRIIGAANLLINFYTQALPVVMNAEQYKKKLREDIELVYKRLKNPLFSLSDNSISQVKTTLISFLETHEKVFEKRISEGRIIEGHGDLKPEHICLGYHPAIIDCLEFRQDLRVLDSAEELSFLEIECERLGDPSTGKLFFDIYKEKMGNRVPETLHLFYKAKRAYLRTFLVIRHILESNYKDDPKWIKMATIYLKMSEKYCRQLEAHYQPIAL